MSSYRKIPKDIKVYDFGPAYSDRFYAVYTDNSVFSIGESFTECKYVGKECQINFENSSVRSHLPSYLLYKIEKMRV